MHDTRMTRSATVEPARSKRTAPTVEADEPVDIERACEKQVTCKRSGLCTTCSHADSCTFPFQADRPVLQCEELDGGQCAVTVCDSAPEGATADAHSDPEAASRHIGLCGTCAHRDECTFSKPEGGVWHCEEFE